MQVPARRVARRRAPGATRPASSTRRSGRATRTSSSRCARCAADAHGLYATHTRRRDEGADGGGRRGAPHGGARRGAAAGLAPRAAQRDRGSSAAASSSSSGAASSGMDVAFDMHTRTFGLTNLYAALPPWALADPRELRAVLGDQARRDAMRDHRQHPQRGRRLVAASCCSTTRRGPSTRAATSPRSRPSAARTRSTRSTTCCSAALDELEQLMVIIHAYSEEQQREAFAHPLCVPGSDATTLAPDGPLAARVLPRRVHVGRVVLALHGARGAAARRRRRPSTG